MARRSMYSHDRLHVDVVSEDGAIRIEGQDLRGAEEYEYVFTVEAADVPALVAALGGGDPVGRLVEQGEAIVARGEMHWLEDHGVPYTLSTL